MCSSKYLKFSQDSPLYTKMKKTDETNLKIRNRRT